MSIEGKKVFFIQIRQNLKSLSYKKSLYQATTITFTTTRRKKTINQESEKISIEGVGNVAIGSFLADGIKALLKTPDNKPTTKSDIKIILDCISQLHKIEKMPPRSDGAKAYFDIFSKRIVYKSPTGNISSDNPFRLV